MNKKLSLVGCGIKTIAHLTKETVAHIKKADFVLFLVNEPLMEEWISTNAKKTQNLASLYFSEKNRSSSYQLITEEILCALKLYEFICVVFYGHPTVFALPGLEAIKKAKEQGAITKILPAVSAEDCLFADLEIDPGHRGCYSVEASDLLIYQRQPDVSSDLIIWQVGMLGNLGHETTTTTQAKEILMEYLMQFYSPTHLVTLYEASFYPGMNYSQKKFFLHELSHQTTSRISTLYVPPKQTKIADSSILKKLGFS